MTGSNEFPVSKFLAAAFGAPFATCMSADKCGYCKHGQSGAHEVADMAAAPFLTFYFILNFLKHFNLAGFL